MTLPYSLWQSSKGTAGFGQAFVGIIADCGIVGEDATPGKVLLCVEVGAIEADMRRSVRFSWRGLVQHLSLLQADGEAEVLGCIREAVDNAPWSFLCVGETNAVVSKQLLSEFYVTAW